MNKRIQRSIDFNKNLDAQHSIIKIKSEPGTEDLIEFETEGVDLSCLKSEVDDPAYSMETDDEGHPCDDCGASFDEITSRPHVCKRMKGWKMKHVKRIVKEEKRILGVTCSYCDKIFKGKFQLKAHFRSHFGLRPFKCKFCLKRFTQKGNLRTHLRLHSGVKPYSCKVCQKQFNQSYDLTIHMRVHTGEKPYSCEGCHRSFARKDVLMKHSRIHSGIKPFQCQQCPKTFSRVDALKSHFKNIH